VYNNNHLVDASRIVLLVIAAAVHVRFSLVSLNYHHILQNAGMVTNEST
jgi:hypothetical protein